MANEEPIDLLQLVEHCGCGAKCPAADLHALLSEIRRADDPRVVVGLDTFDDGAVYRLKDDCLIVQTVDFFPPVASRPDVYGRIAAANALSDIYAMGGRPVTAMSMLCLPAAGKIPLSAVRDILNGAVEKITEAGAVLVGGHTLTDPQLKFGLSVTGIVEPGQILGNAMCKPGDIMILTKPLGTGLTITAAKAGMAKESSIQQANRFMSALNAKACAAALAAHAHSATDITGFGFLGHAWQMAKASGVQMRFHAESVPLMDETLAFASMGLVPAGAYANRRFLEERVEFSTDLSLARQDTLFDPQTSGGLLVCLSPEDVPIFQAALAEQSDCCCRVVGYVEAGDKEPRLYVEK
jgi:selenide,water dikinase